MQSSPLHVVFGAGQIGSHLTDRLLQRGERVRTVRRSTHASRHSNHEAVTTDVQRLDAAIQAAAGATVVYNCVGVPYDRWADVLPPACRHMALAARSARARLVVLDNVYAVGATGTFSEDTPERPCSRKGVLRKQLADELRAMHDKGDLQVTIGRASDFFGPGVDNSTLLHMRAIRQLLEGRAVDIIGKMDQPHSWSYAPDVAEGLLQLGLHPELAGNTLHLPVLPAQSGRSLLAALARELGVPLKVRSMPARMLNLAGWFNPMMRELAEMQYQFRQPFIMSDARIRSLLGLEPTPLSDQVTATANWLRAIGGADPAPTSRATT